MDAISPLCTGKLFYCQHHPLCGKGKSYLLKHLWTWYLLFGSWSSFSESPWRSFIIRDFTNSSGSFIYAWKSIITEYFKFNQRKQCDEESVMVYIIQLLEFSINCRFGNTLNDMLRDRLVCGLSSPKIQKFLLHYKKLTFAQARDRSFNGTSRRERKIH